MNDEHEFSLIDENLKIPSLEQLVMLKLYGSSDFFRITFPNYEEWENFCRVVNRQIKYHDNRNN